MRVNIYSQELTDEVELVSKESNTGKVYQAVRLYLHSSPLLHNDPSDDDRSAITIWLPSSSYRKQELADSFKVMAKLIELQIQEENQ